MWKPRLKLLLTQKAYDEGRVIPQSEVVEKTGVRQPTVSTWMQPHTRLAHVEARLAATFAAYLDCDPRDLFEYVDDGGDRRKAETA